MKFETLKLAMTENGRLMNHYPITGCIGVCNYKSFHSLQGCHYTNAVTADHFSAQ